MAGAGYKLFVSGDVLTAAQVNTYLNEQTVMVFATSAARTSALSLVLAEGMMSYLQDSNTVFYYDGAAWNALASGDITAITAGTGISVTSGTGPVPTVAIDTAVTVDLTTAQTLTNKTLTSPALTTPTISTLTTNGDLVYGTGSGALSRLGIGSSAQVLTVASGVPSWATPAGGGGMTLLQTNTLSGTSYTTGSIDQSYKQLQILLRNISSSGQDSIFFRLNSDTGSNYYWGGLLIAQSAANAYYAQEPGTNVLIAYENMSGTSRLNAVVNLYRYTDTDEIFFDFGTTAASTSFTPDLGRMTLTGTGIYNNSAAITTMTIGTGTGNVSGTMYVYGVS